jgi:signal transduction histidine kinase
MSVESEAALMAVGGEPIAAGLLQRPIDGSLVPNRPARGAEISDRRQRDRDRARRSFRLRQTVSYGLGGLVFGYAVLHPVTMAVFAWFELHDASRGSWFVVQRMVDSFAPTMLPMAIVFGIFGLLLGALEGYYRSLVGFQRNDLARELRLKEGYRFELERTVHTLEQQNHRLRDLELGKRRMTRFLVHDFKNHLGCVLGYVTVLLGRSRKGGWARQDIDALECVRRQASRMAASVKDFLDLARLEEIPGIRTRLVSAQAVLKEALEIASVPPDHAEVRIEPAVDPELYVLCDNSMVARVVSNLILNAVKHNRRGVGITLGVYRRARTIAFECRDTGEGIPRELADRLFDEFSTSGEPHDSSPSHGLGLAFCKAAVTAHGGRIWVESDSTRGTRFTFTIPSGGTPE